MPKPHLLLQRGNLFGQPNILPSTVYQIGIGPVQSLSQRLHLGLQPRNFLLVLSLVPLHGHLLWGDLVLQRALLRIAHPHVRLELRWNITPLNTISWRIKSKDTPRMRYLEKYKGNLGKKCFIWIMMLK